MLSSYISGAEEEKNIVSKLSDRLYSFITKEKTLTIAFYPSIENYVASSIALSALSVSDIRVVLLPTIDYVSVETPTLILDGKTTSIRVDASHKIHIVKSKKILEDKGNSIRVGLYSTMPSVMLKIFEKTSIITDAMYSYALIFSANEEKPKALDHELLNEAQNKEVVEKYEAALKIFEWHKLPICDALSLTLNPFVPGISGDKDQCINILTSEGVDIVDSKGMFKKIVDLSDKELEKLVEVIFKRLKQKLKASSIEGLVSRTYIITKSTPINVDDVRYAYQVLCYVSELTDPGYIPASMINKLYASYIKSIYIAKARDIALELNNILLGNKLEIVGEKAFIVEASKEIPPSLIGDIARKYLGLSNRIAIVCSGGKCYTSTIELEQTNISIKLVDGIVVNGVRVESKTYEELLKSIGDTIE